MVVQLMLLIAVVLLGLWAINNARTNLNSRHVGSGFDFLLDPAGFGISESLIPYQYGDSYLRAFLAGIVNTLRAAIPAIFASTVIGFFLGIAAVSRNPLVSAIARIYVDIVRNLPLLVQVLLWYFSLTELLPDGSHPIHFRSFFFLSKEGLSLPLPVGNLSFVMALFVTLAGLVCAVLLSWRYPLSKKRVWLGILALTIIVLYLVPVVSGTPYQVVYPEPGAYAIEGPMALSPEYVAIVGALTAYSAAYFSEIVRAGIEAVPRGQWEGAHALSLSRSQTLSRVVLPQALPVIVPPYISLFVNTIKNSSLAVAIGYPDIVSVTTTAMNQNGRAIECISIIAAVYLTLSLLTSVAMNAYNRRIAIKER